MSEHVPMPHLTDPTILLTLTGPDRPGVSTALFERLSAFPLEVVDVEQLVVRGRLVLSALVTRPDKHEQLAEAVRDLAADLALHVEIEHGVGDNRPRRVGRANVTVLGHPLEPSAMAALTSRIASAGGNIDRILRLARYPVTALRLEISGAEPDDLQTLLLEVAVDHGIDVAVEEHGILRHAQRLVVMDVDSTLIQGEVIDMLAAHAGIEAEMTSATESAMRGELDFETSIRQRVAMLAGLDASLLDSVRRDIQFTPGARTMIRTLKRLGYRFALVSGGFRPIIEPLAEELGIDYVAANELEIADGRLTGRLTGPVVDRAGKADALRRFADEAGVALRNTIAIGDGANDLDMLAAAGLGVAFNAKPLVRDQAKTSVNVPYLDSIVYLLGITREEIEAADAAD
ncbi:MAG TPA: phosphoserine phosphatase SerB [Aeromicrobium sp.]|nr:phosphoserine phosphatase SerB [Aeromicrobium sp.]